MVLELVGIILFMWGGKWFWDASQDRNNEFSHAPWNPFRRYDIVSYEQLTEPYPSVRVRVKDRPTGFIADGRNEDLAWAIWRAKHEVDRMTGRV